MARSVSIDEDIAPNISVKQGHPHLTEGRLKKRPIDAVEGLLLIQRQNSKREVGLVGVVDYITKESHIFPDKTVGNLISFFFFFFLRVILFIDSTKYIYR